jgi:competence ComEA-like helix-hairpin-helix protein
MPSAKVEHSLSWLQTVLWVVGLGFVVALIMRWWQTPTLLARRVQSLPQHPLIQVYTNHNLAAQYREPYRDQTRPGDNLEQVIVDHIRQARSSIDVAVQELRSPLITQALRERYIAGVRVRVVLENIYSRPWSSFTASEVQQLDARMQSRYRENLRLIDRDGNKQLSADEINTYDALQVMRQAGIPWLDDTADGSAGSGLMHHKFVVIDGKQVIVTSANFTLSDLHGDFVPQQSLGNANSLVVIQSEALAAHFTNEFAILWGDGPGGKSDSQFGVKKPFRPAAAVAVGDANIRVKFSPTPADVPWEFSSNGLIAQTVAQGRKSIDLALFVFSDQQIANQLETTARQGASVRVLIEPSFAYQFYSEALDLLGVALPARRRPAQDEEAESPNEGEGRSNTLCPTEVNNHPWTKPLQTVGVTQLPPGDLLHHKFGVMDVRTVIVGSHNWTEAADHQNDETLLVIEHPTVAAHYQREYERLWANSRLGLPSKVREAAQELAQQCPTAVDQPTDSTVTTSPSSPTQRLNLNTASQAELEQLPGIGPTLAQRIIQARQQRPFQSLADLDQVPGMGPKVLEQIRNRITW